MSIPSRPSIPPKKVEVPKEAGKEKELDQKESGVVEEKGRVWAKEEESKGKEIMIPKKHILPETLSEPANVEQSEVINYELPTELLLMIAQSPNCDIKTANAIIRTSKILYELSKKTDLEEFKKFATKHKIDWKIGIILKVIAEGDSLPLKKLGKAVTLDPHLSVEEGKKNLAKALVTLQKVQDAHNGLIQSAANLVPYSHDIMIMLGINALALFLPMMVVSEFPGLMALAALAIPMTYFFGATKETATATGVFLKAPQMLPPGMAIAVIIAVAMVYSDLNIGTGPLAAFTTGVTALKDDIKKSIENEG